MDERERPNYFVLPLQSSVVVVVMIVATDNKRELPHDYVQFVLPLRSLRPDNFECVPPWQPFRPNHVEFVLPLQQSLRPNYFEQLSLPLTLQSFVIHLAAESAVE